MSELQHLEALAEAIVFAHEADAAAPPASDPQATALQRTAALTAAALAHRCEVPAGLQARLAAAGLQFCATRAQLAAPAPRRPLSVTVTGWRTAVAFVGGIAAGLVLWLLLRTGAPVEPPVAERRAALLPAADVQWHWQAGSSPLRGDVQGDVVWSSDRQEGYLRFRGLPPLDARHRFQLWIVDGKREGAPVDGGLFAVGDGGAETVVPVRAALPIGQAAAFVVTVEDERGAVVSLQQHVVAIAKP
ncbi:MAG: anti-sigma factor [Planctomycetes bacterium]|nr:anti-sigma factor [Planctomycetota bacterium]